MATDDLRRYRGADASRVLHELGAPRSKHTLKKDHLKQPGEAGPRFMRDARGTCWYWHRDLEAWAAQQRAQLSANNLPPAPFFDSAAALARRGAGRNPLKTAAVADSPSSAKPGKNSRVAQLLPAASGPGSRSESRQGRRP